NTFGADAQRWLFLTGNDEAIHSIIERSFQTRPQRNLDPNAAPGVRVTHSNRLFLVDKRGMVRGNYACVESELSPQGELTGSFRIDEDTLQRLAHDAERLDQGPFSPYLRLRSLPAINATLNGTSAVLVLMGYGFIRRRRIRAHMRCMLGA